MVFYKNARREKLLFFIRLLNTYLKDKWKISVSVIIFFWNILIIPNAVLYIIWMYIFTFTDITIELEGYNFAHHTGECLSLIIIIFFNFEREREKL